MKKELVGLSVCIMLVAVAFVPNIAADDGLESSSLSEQYLAELEDRLLELNDRLLAADTLAEKEPILREMVSLFDEYGVLPDDMTVDEAFDIIKTNYVGDEQLEIESYENLINKIEPSNPNSPNPVGASEYLDIKFDKGIGLQIKIKCDSTTFYRLKFRWELLEGKYKKIPLISRNLFDNDGNVEMFHWYLLIATSSNHMAKFILHIDYRYPDGTYENRADIPGRLWYIIVR